MVHQRRKEHRPEEILDAAMEVFGEKGFAATRMSDIAAKAGISRPTLYLYYKNKMAIFEALLDQKLKPIVGDARLAIANSDMSASKLLEQILGKIIRTANHPDIMPILRMILLEGANFPELTSVYLSEMLNPGRMVIRELIRQGVENGEFKSSAINLDPRLFVAPGIMSIMWQTLFSEDEKLDVEQLIADHFSLVFEGLKNR